MARHKVYGYCERCYEGVISIIKSDKKDNSNTLYQCPVCGKYSTFDFSSSDELEERVKEAEKNIKNK